MEESAVGQIKQLLSVDVFSNCKIRIMPDVHAGAGCVIGFTGNLGDKVIPNIVGVDIGCGILVQPFRCLKDIDFHALNEFILKVIPSGRNHQPMNICLCHRNTWRGIARQKALFDRFVVIVN